MREHSSDFVLVARDDAGEDDGDEVDPINYKEFHKFADELRVGELEEEEGFVVVDEEFDEVDFGKFEICQQPRGFTAHAFGQGLDFLVEFGGAWEVHVAELLGEQQIFEMPLDVNKTAVPHWVLLFLLLA